MWVSDGPTAIVDGIYRLPVLGNNVTKHVTSKPVHAVKLGNDQEISLLQIPSGVRVQVDAVQESQDWRTLL
jgi:hypothetical protein